MKVHTEGFPIIHIILLICILPAFEIQASIMDWMWNREDEIETQNKPKVGDKVTFVKVPFEAKTEDEKFLEEAKKYTGLKLSELDSCQHTVVMKIRTSCSELTEEELAKLSVNLLNCQSAVEGRQQFPCTEIMSLRQCTSAMDSDMWNTYHLMSNRARAVCYAARHQEFRALSEMTVNKLMDSAHNQLVAMDLLREGQQKLESVTAGTLESVSMGQESLLKQQERMRVTQQNLRDFVGLNLRELTKEKALIAAGHRELTKMTEDVKQKLDEASAQLLTQSAERQENHKEILNDLQSIQAQANIIWSEIEHSTKEILTRHEVAAAQYEDTLHKLAKINATVSFLLQLMETTKQELDERLGWLGSLVGETGVYLFALHGLYLLVAMIATSFLQAPPITRLVLVLIVPLNLAVIYHHGKQTGLDFASMTMLILAITAVHWFVTSVQACLFNTKQVPTSYTNGTHLNGAPVKLSPVSQVSLLSSTKMGFSVLCAMATNYINLFMIRSKKILSNKPSDSSTSPKVNHSWDTIPDSLHHHDDDSSDSDVSLYSHTGPVITEFQESVRRHRDTDSPLRNQDTGSPSLRHRLTTPYFPSPPTPSRTSSRSGTPLRSGLPRAVCRAMCRSGQPCRNTTTVGSDVCRVHTPDSSNISLRDTF